MKSFATLLGVYYRLSVPHSNAAVSQPDITILLLLNVCGLFCGVLQSHLSDLRSAKLPAPITFLGYFCTTICVAIEFFGI